MIVSINPSYLCNFNCSFCYLGPRLRDRTQIAPDKLAQLLAELTAFYPITGVDLYGGEIGLLKEDYFQEILAVIRNYFSDEINITTNLSRVPTFFYHEGTSLAVSYDGPAREKHEIVFKNMKSLKRSFRILMLGTPELVQTDPEHWITLFNGLDQLESVEIKPYSQNQYNQLSLTWREGESWVKRWLQSEQKKKFLFINEENIKECLKGVYNAYSDDHIYITPDGTFAVLDFDESDREYFRPVKDMGEYVQWCFHEKEKQSRNTICNHCEYMGHCLTEHLREVKSRELSCNGGYELLNWYATRFGHGLAGNNAAVDTQNVLQL